MVMEVTREVKEIVVSVIVFCVLCTKKKGKINTFTL